MAWPALPVSPITDLRVVGSDLVVATQGRSLWILDDLSPLRQMSTELGAPHLFRPRPAISWIDGAGHRDRRGPVGSNPPFGAIIHFLLPADFDAEADDAVEREHGGQTWVRLSGRRTGG